MTDLIDDERLEDDIARWQDEYAGFSPEVPWRTEVIVRHARQHRSMRLTRRVLTVAAVTAVAVGGIQFLGRPQPPQQSNLRPAVTGTYSFTSTGCATRARTCSGVIATWLTAHGQVPLGPITFLAPEERPNPLGPGHRMRWEGGYVSMEVRLASGSDEAPVDLFVQISPSTTSSVEPISTWVGTGVTVKLKDGSSADYVGSASKSKSKWQTGHLVHAPAVTGHHPAIDVDISRANLSNSGVTPPMPLQMDKQAVIDLVNALI